MKTQSLLQKLDNLPPFMVYAFARKNRTQRPSLEELAKSAGIPSRTFTRIARKFSWAGVKAGHIDSFCRACGVNILSQGKHLDYWRHVQRYKRPFCHLSPQQMRTFNAQCEKLMEMRRKAATA